MMIIIVMMMVLITPSLSLSSKICTLYDAEYITHTTQCANTRTQYAMCIHITHLQDSKAIFEISKRRCPCLTMSPPLTFPDWPVTDVHLQLKALQCIFEWECTCSTVSSAHITHVAHIPICVHSHKFTASNIVILLLHPPVSHYQNLSFLSLECFLAIHIIACWIPLLWPPPSFNSDSTKYPNLPICAILDPLNLLCPPQKQPIL